MIIFLYGVDTYRSHQQLNYYLEKFKEKRDAQGTSIIKLEGQELTIDGFRKNIFSAGLFSEKRMIIIKNLLSESKDESLIKEIADSIKKLEKESNVIIFYEKSEPTKNKSIQKLFQLLKKQKHTKKFDFLEKIELEKWIKDYCQKNKTQIDSQAIFFLIDFFGADLWTIKNEIDKAASYGEEKIILKILNLLCEVEKEETIFNLVDALIGKNKKRAVKLLEQELNKGTFFTQIIERITYQFRIILCAKEAKNKNIYQIAKELGVHHFPVKKAIEQGRTYQTDELKKIYQEILKIDFQLKTSSRDPELLFDLLIAKL